MVKVRRFFSAALVTILLFTLTSLSHGADNFERSDPNQPAYKPGEVIVKFAPYAAAERLEQVRAQAGLATLRHFPRFSLRHMRITSPNVSVQEAIKRLKSFPEVIYAEPNYFCYADAMPNDPSFSSLWGLHNTGQTGGTPDADIDAPEAWDITTGDSSIVVAVIDSGIDYNHPDLSANMWKNPAELSGDTGVDDDGNGYIDDIYGIDALNNDSDPFDDNRHGTHCAGTIGARGNNATGVVGVNWNIQIMALKFLSSQGSGPISDAIECLEYAVMMKSVYGVNLKLTSNSWGSFGYSRALKDAIAACAAEDILFVAAAGNYGLDNDALPFYPSSYEVPNVIAVAATDHFDLLRPWSQYGSYSVDLAAPGAEILSTTPGNTYELLRGTSMATPHVSGTAALLWALDPSLSYLAVKETLLSSVDHLPALEGAVLTGGRLNAFNALTCDPTTVNLALSIGEGFTAEQGVEEILTVRLEACEWLKGATITATFTDGSPELTLADDGISPDKVAGDGIYSAGWTPPVLGPVTVTITAVHDLNTYSETVSGNVIEFMGYYYDDTVPFAWIDISESGTPLSLPDNGSSYFSIPFPVTFYDTAYSDIAVDSNGTLFFCDAQSWALNSCIPQDFHNCNTFIAGLWDDLNPSAGGTVFWQVLGTAPERMLIVQYQDVPHFLEVGAVSFQIILYEDSSNILMQYLDVSFEYAIYDFGASATVGLQRDAHYGQQYSCGEPVLRNESAILWFRPNDCSGGKGDVNNDGLISSADAILALRIAAGLDIGPSRPANECELRRCDVNCDDVRNSGDAVLILRETAGLEPDICPMSSTLWRTESNL